MDVLHVDVC